MQIMEHNEKKTCHNGLVFASFSLLWLVVHLCR